MLRPGPQEIPSDAACAFCACAYLLVMQLCHEAVFSPAYVSMGDPVIRLFYKS